MKKYVFRPYSEIFPKLFAAEKIRIAKSIETDGVIEHVGSTAIPGLGGKGIIDIAIAVDKEKLETVYHIHLTYPESSEWKELVGFRDYLRNYPKEAEEYAELKRKAAMEANQDGEKYRKLKEPIFKKIKSFIKTKNEPS